MYIFIITILIFFNRQISSEQIYYYICLFYRDGLSLIFICFDQNIEYLYDFLWWMRISHFRLWKNCFLLVLGVVFRYMILLEILYWIIYLWIVLEVRERCYNYYLANLHHTPWFFQSISYYLLHFSIFFLKITNNNGEIAPAKIKWTHWQHPN